MPDLNDPVTRGRLVANDYANRHIQHSRNAPTDFEIVTRILTDLMWFVANRAAVPDMEFSRLYREADYRFHVNREMED